MNVLNTKEAPAAIGPYSQGISAENAIYTSGQLPIDMKTGELETGDIKKATKHSLDNCKAVLAAAGAALDQVVKTTVFMTDLGDFAAMNEVYASYFPANPPARSCVQVAALPKGAKIEIEMVAVK
ncbi:RidA family protein [Spirochaetia bacterium]|nr:RidA family protein [Spirochaetia bacterium]